MQSGYVTKIDKIDLLDLDFCCTYANIESKFKKTQKNIDIQKSMNPNSSIRMDYGKTWELARQLPKEKFIGFLQKMHFLTNTNKLDLIQRLNMIDVENDRIDEVTNSNLDISNDPISDDFLQTCDKNVKSLALDTNSKIDECILDRK